MLKKIFSTPILFCIVSFLALPVCISYRITDPFISPRMIMVSAGVFSACIMFLFRKPAANNLLPNTPIWALLLFLFLSLLSVSKSLNPGDACYEWLKSFLIFPVILIVAGLFGDEHKKKLLLKFSQAGVLILSAFYFYQWFYYLQNKNLEFVLDLKLHIASTLGNKNFYAEVICLLFPFSVISIFSLNNGWKILSAWNAVILICSLVLTQSYAAIIAFITAGMASSVAFYFTNSGRNLPAWKVIGLIASLLLIIGFGIKKSGTVKSFNQRVETIQEYFSNPEQIDSTTKANSNSTFERILLWRNSIKLIRDNPLTGCGMNNWKLFYPKYGIGGTRYIEGGNVHYEHPHNDYLLIAAESGIPALLAFLVFLISIAWFANTEMKKHETSRLWMAGITFAVISLIIVSIFSFPRMRFYGWMLIGIYAGLFYSFKTFKKEVKSGFGNKPRMNLLVCTALSAWALVASIFRYDGEVHSRMLQVAKKQQNFSRVVRESEKATSWYFPIDETATPFTWYKGMAMFYSGNVSGAKIEFEDALKKNPYHIQLLNDLATTCEQTNERERAISLYQRALSITPFFPQSLLNISACYFNIGRKDSAFIYIDELYGIKLAYHEKRSYDAYLPAILREKIYMEANQLPDDIRERAVGMADDSSLVNATYRFAKGKKAQFLMELTASLRGKE